MNGVRSRRKLSRMCLVFGPAIVLILVLPMASAHTFVAPWQTPWYSNGGWPPCSGSNTWDGGNSNNPNTATGEYNLYSDSVSTTDLFCGANTADKSLIGGLHGGQYSVGGTLGTAYTYEFSYSMTITLYQYLACSTTESGAYAAPWAETEFFAAIWDTSGSFNWYGNVYYTPLALQMSSAGWLGCDSSQGQSGINVVCDQTFTSTASVTLYGENTYQPRVGVYTETNTNDNSGAYESATALNDLWFYNSYCGLDNGVVLNYIDFTPVGGAPAISSNFALSALNDTHAL